MAKAVPFRFLSRLYPENQKGSFGFAKDALS